MGDIAELANNPLYGPGGILAGSIVCFALARAAQKLEWLPQKVDLINTFAALSVIGAYIYLWYAGNPHDGELKDNGDEYVDAPLFILGGFYLSALYPYKGGLKSFFYLVNLAWILSLMVFKKGSNIGIVFGVLMEAPMITETVLRLLQAFSFHECLIIVVKYFAVPFYAATRLIGAGYTVLKLAEKEDVPAHVKGLACLAYATSLLLMVGFIDLIRDCEEEPENGKVRGRSRGRARSRSSSQQRKGASKSRSRSRTPRRRR